MDGASFDDLCINYAQERLQMLFHDFTFTSEQDRYMQEEINWMFSEVAASPLPVIDTIDRHVPQVRVRERGWVGVETCSTDVATLSLSSRSLVVL